jgi:hypothetical protein
MCGFLQHEVMTHDFQFLGHAAGFLPGAQSGAPTADGKIVRQSRWFDHLSQKQKRRRSTHATPPDW